MRRRIPGLREIVVRGRQEAGKWIERTPQVGRLTGGVQRRPGAPPRLDLQAFFPGPLDAAATALVAARWPEAAADLVAVSDAATRGRFDLLGYDGLDFGTPPDWQLEPVAGRRAPEVHWSRIDGLAYAQVGDSKVVWELSRHQWIVQLALASRLTGDRRHAAAAVAALRDWRAGNPRGTGIHWNSSLEVAFRLIAWSWTAAWLEGTDAFTPAVRDEVAEGIAEHASHVARYLSTYYSPNTHLTGEALGLLYAGVVLPTWPEAARWRATGLRILVAEAGRHILDDGIYFEQAACYQRYTAEFYLHLLVLAGHNGLAVPEAVSARVQRLLDALVVLRHPDGTLPQVGDTDGGWLLPLVRRPQTDARGVLAVAAAWFGRADYAWAAGASQPEVALLLGGDGVRAFEALAPAPPAGPSSRVFLSGGYAVLRTSWEPDAQQAIVDVGPLGCPVSGGHGHADLLSVQVAAFGEPILVDAGTGGYTAERGWRTYFRGTAAHNTLRVDGRDQAVSTGPFRWQAPRPSATLRGWQAGPDMVIADASHEAFSTPGEPLEHRRRVALVRGRDWLIVDDVTGGAPHLVELRFQAAPGVRVLEFPDGWHLVIGRHHGLWLHATAATPLACAVHEGNEEPRAGWVSPDYGRIVPAPQLLLSTTIGAAARIVTLLVPVAHAAAQPPEVPPAVEALRALDGAVTALRWPAHEVRIDHHALVLTTR